MKTGEEVELRILNQHGWLLVYLSNTCFPYLSNRQDKFDPSKCKHYIINHITEKLYDFPQDKKISDVFADLEKVFVYYS